MKLSFFGADREVTGSCHCLDVGGKRVLIDCGLIQGRHDDHNLELPFDPAGVDAVILTHAHIDHSGRLPLLTKMGYKGKIIATPATNHLLTVMLRDSAHIQASDAQWKNQKGKRAGKQADEPLYTVLDAEACLKQLQSVDYGRKTALFDGFTFTFIDAGHLLGSATVDIHITENGVSRHIVFSGDIGNVNQPIIRDPTYLTAAADYVVMENTYGDRDHEPSDDYTADLAKIIDTTLRRGGNVVIPSFAVGRTQELLYFIREIKERRLTPSAPDFPVYVDSPLAAEATKIYGAEIRDCGDEEILAVLRAGTDPIACSNLHLCESLDESKALNADRIPKVIISSSGMCEAGRIKHHLKHNLWRPECSVVFVGFQADGTLGRKLMDGASAVRLFGEEIAVKAQVHSFRGLSAHADMDGLVKWISSFENVGKVFIVHGESEVCDSFSGVLRQRGLSTYVPNFNACYDLAADAEVSAGMALPTPAGGGQSTAFTRLYAAGQRLVSAIGRSKGFSNKELGRMTGQLDELMKKWEE